MRATFIVYEKGIPKRPITWDIETVYVDDETGEQITKHQAKTNYIKIKTNQHATITNVNATRGQITRVNRYKRKAQLNLFEEGGRD